MFRNCAGGQPRGRAIVRGPGLGTGGRRPPPPPSAHTNARDSLDLGVCGVGHEVSVQKSGGVWAAIMASCNNAAKQPPAPYPLHNTTQTPPPTAAAASALYMSRAPAALVCLGAMTNGAGTVRHCAVVQGPQGPSGGGAMILTSCQTYSRDFHGFAGGQPISFVIFHDFFVISFVILFYQNLA